MPVIRLARDGLQAGAEQCALVKSTPFCARRSRLGVFTSGWPPRQPIQSFKSSIAIKRTFGLSFVDLAEKPARGSANAAAPAAVSLRNSRRFIEHLIPDVSIFPQEGTPGSLLRKVWGVKFYPAVVCPGTSFSAVLQCWPIWPGSGVWSMSST